MSKQTDLEFFERRVFKPETPCWNWRAYIGKKGYAQWRRNGRDTAVHRVAYELLIGAIPDGMEVHHTCFNRSCVNPEHLALVTRKENMAETAKLRTHCPHGHEYTPENTYLRGNGYRQCRACVIESSRRRYPEVVAERRAQGVLPRADYCKNGHPRTEENTYISPSGHRKCRLCLQAKYLKPGGYKDPGRQTPTHCPHGHEYTAENTYVSPDGRSRYCRECNRASSRRCARRSGR